MKSTQKSIVILAILWFLGTAIRFLFYHEINEKLWVLSLLIDGALVLTGVILAFVLLFRKRRNPIIAAAAMIALMCLGWLTPIGWKTGTYFRMWRMEATYEKEVARIMELDDEALEDLKSPAEIDNGPPRRIAFSWGGIIDNWSGIVYDPSGEVLKAREFESDWSNWGDPKLADVRTLFGGDLRNAHHLWGHWYYCEFT